MISAADLEKRLEVYYPRVKRSLDILFSVILILLSLPLFLIVPVMIKLDSKGPVLFRQTRFGKARLLFFMYRFRTINMSAPAKLVPYMLETPELYATRTGRILKKTGLDELPVLFNIFKGDMSFIGPVSALWTQAPLISEREKYGINSARPGLISFRCSVSAEGARHECSLPAEKKYIEEISFLLDFRILLNRLFTPRRPLP